MAGRNIGEAGQERWGSGETARKNQAVLTRWANALGGLVGEFVEYLEKRREAPQTLGVSPPPFIKSIDDLEKTIRLQQFLLDEVAVLYNTTTKKSEYFYKAVKETPGAKELIISLHRRAYKMEEEDDEKKRQRPSGSADDAHPIT